MIERLILLFKQFNLALLAGDDLGKLTVLFDLSLKFGGEILDWYFELVNDHFFLTDKIQLNKASESEFQDFFIFLQSFEILTLKDIF